MEPAVPVRKRALPAGAPTARGIRALIVPRRPADLAALVLVLAAGVGCVGQPPSPQPARPSGDCAPCGALKLVIEHESDRFVRGEPAPNTRAECQSLDAALRDYIRCECSREELGDKYDGIDGEAFGAWLLHCRDVLNGPPPTLAVRN